MTKNSSPFPRLSLRPATETDLPLIAALQAASWQSAYRGLVTDAYLDNDVPQHLADRWSAWPTGDWRVDTIWQDATLLGFVTLDLDHAGGPYVDNLHIAPQHKGLGLGRRLLARAAGHAQDALKRPAAKHFDPSPYDPNAAPCLWLTVIAENTASRKFYTKMGGTEGAPQTEFLYGTPVNAVPVAWSGAALEKLAASSC